MIEQIPSNKLLKFWSLQPITSLREREVPNQDAITQAWHLPEKKLKI